MFLDRRTSSWVTALLPCPWLVSLSLGTSVTNFALSEVSYFLQWSENDCFIGRPLHLSPFSLMWCLSWILTAHLRKKPLAAFRQATCLYQFPIIYSSPRSSTNWSTYFWLGQPLASSYFRPVLLLHVALTYTPCLQSHHPPPPVQQIHFALPPIGPNQILTDLMTLHISVDTSGHALWRHFGMTLYTYLWQYGKLTTVINACCGGDSLRLCKYLLLPQNGIQYFYCCLTDLACRKCHSGVPMWVSYFPMSPMLITWNSSIWKVFCFSVFT
jgi:hypothetical protein